MEKTLIIGAGEIGKSLGQVLSQVYDVCYEDINKQVSSHLSRNVFEQFQLTEKDYSIIHICYPYNKNFITSVKEYRKKYNPDVVIIHSTVPVGTTRKLGKGFVHSPVVGKHPHLAKSMLTFKKFIGSLNGQDARDAQLFLQKAGIKVHHFSSPEATEFAKIMCTTQYGWSIIIMKEIERLCEQYGVPFLEVYQTWNEHYNEGYQALGDGHFTRPILSPMRGKIGGHCVIPNCKLLDSYITKIIQEKNEQF